MEADSSNFWLKKKKLQLTFNDYRFAYNVNACCDFFGKTDDSSGISVISR